jgi:deoxyribodipyrimidine photolyase-related protein|tara:strand:- start:41 stop:1369 length:1329 start_codon:yes stop_codon:yes gene_type:complete
MKYYESFLQENNKEVLYIEQEESISDVRELIPYLKKEGYNTINYILTNDNYLERRLTSKAKKNEIELNAFENPMFLNSSLDLESFFRSDKKKFYQTSFYIEQRKKLGILLDASGNAEGGKWSFDTENRKKYPKTKLAPKIEILKADNLFLEAKKYVEKHFKNNPGDIPEKPIYPHTHELSKSWLYLFLKDRMQEFGPYEDAMVQKESFLNHSVLSPLLNSGLITPINIIEETLKYKDDYPINSIEGFLRQIIGWREFIRGVYKVKGSQERTTNFFNFKRKIPKSFYDATTGILPIDITIKKVQKTAYNHHIERLMVLGNFMMLCEFDPDEIYRWFMEHYIDAYDWVMVPNVYGMSQFADGGLMSTKPYISSSNYLKKMSDFPNGDWQQIWDALYWRFIDLNRELFAKNIRMKFMVSMLDKMPDEKRINHFKIANEYLDSLDG